MSEPASVSRTVLTAGQFHLIARKYGALSGRAIVDVGCGDGEWTRSLRKRGSKIQGMEERKKIKASEDEAVVIGSPAAAVPWEAQTLDCVLLRGTSVLDASEFSPEVMIALANLGSSLKRRGRLVIPVATPDGDEFARWKNQLSIFPGTVRVRTLKTGIAAYLTLAFLFRGVHQISLVEFQVTGKPMSRLEWHRLARETVLSRLPPPAAA